MDTSATLDRPSSMAYSWSTILPWTSRPGLSATLTVHRSRRGGDHRLLHRRDGAPAWVGQADGCGLAWARWLGKSGWPVRAALLKMAASSAAWVHWPSRSVCTGGNTDRMPFSSPARGDAGWRLVTDSAWLETRAKMARTPSRHSAARCSLR